jgi:hypothetical protein
LARQDVTDQSGANLITSALKFIPSIIGLFGLVKVSSFSRLKPMLIVLYSGSSNQQREFMELLARQDVSDQSGANLITSALKFIPSILGLFGLVETSLSRLKSVLIL